MKCPKPAIEALVQKNYDLVIAKLISGDVGTLEVLRKAKKLNLSGKVIIIGGGQHIPFPLQTYRIEVDDYLLMPISPSEL